MELAAFRRSNESAVVLDVCGVWPWIKVYREMEFEVAAHWHCSLPEDACSPSMPAV